jgi:GNAT superfamily N-acetyltransferase
MVTWLTVDSASALAAYDAQIRRGSQGGEPGARVERDATVVRWISPDPDGSSCITWSGLEPASADAVIDAQVAYFRARHQKLEWKLYDYDQPADLPRRLIAAGFEAEPEELVMVAETAEITGEVPLADGLSVRELTGAAGVDMLMDVHERVFGDDEWGLRRSLLAMVEQAPESVALVAAFAGDEPVSASRIEFPPGTDFAGLWGGGTLPQWRGKGLYRAQVARRAEIAAARGYRYLQVDALSASQPILARLGFTALARTTPYIWDPGPAPGTLPA